MGSPSHGRDRRHGRAGESARARIGIRSLRGCARTSPFAGAARSLVGPGLGREAFLPARPTGRAARPLAPGARARSVIVVAASYAPAADDPEPVPGELAI